MYLYFKHCTYLRSCIFSNFYCISINVDWCLETVSPPGVVTAEHHDLDCECNVLILGKSHDIPPAALLHCHALWHTSVPVQKKKKDKKTRWEKRGDKARKRKVLYILPSHALAYFDLVPVRAGFSCSWWDVASRWASSETWIWLSRKNMWLCLKWNLEGYACTPVCWGGGVCLLVDKDIKACELFDFTYCSWNNPHLLWALTQKIQHSQKTDTKTSSKYVSGWIK